MVFFGGSGVCMSVHVATFAVNVSVNVLCCQAGQQSLYFCGPGVCVSVRVAAPSICCDSHTVNVLCCQAGGQWKFHGRFGVIMYANVVLLIQVHRSAWLAMPPQYRRFCLATRFSSIWPSVIRDSSMATKLSLILSSGLCMLEFRLSRLGMSYLSTMIDWHPCACCFSSD